MSEQKNFDVTEEERQIKEEIGKLSEQDIATIMFAEPTTSPAEPEYDDEMLEQGETVYTNTLPDALYEEEETYPNIRQEKYVSGNRKKINYGSENEQSIEERRYRALEAAKATKKIVNGVVVAARMVALPNDMEDVLFTVIITDEAMRGAQAYIKGEEMSNILLWNKQNDTKSYTVSLRRRFAKGLINAEIQFCISHISVTNPDVAIEDREYFVSGSRMQANERLKRRYFDESNPNAIVEGDIVNGRVLAAFTNRLVYTVAGVDLYLYYTIPYVTGMSRIIPGTSGKQLFTVNENKDCLIERIHREPQTHEVTKLRVSFYEPLKRELMQKIDTMQENAMYAGTVIRYLPPKENGKTAYIVVKTDIGVEVLCLLPNWKKPPMELDSVKVKIMSVRPNQQETLVLGHIKR